MQAEWGEITLPSPGRLGRAAAETAGRVAKPPYLKERQRSAKPHGGRGRTLRSMTIQSLWSQAVVSRLMGVAKALLCNLAHEMCHVWQQTRAKAPRRGYHDRQWAGKMREVGLQPSSTGEEGGERCV